MYTNVYWMILLLEFLKIIADRMGAKSWVALCGVAAITYLTIEVGEKMSLTGFSAALVAILVVVITFMVTRRLQEKNEAPPTKYSPK